MQKKAGGTKSMGTLMNEAEMRRMSGAGSVLDRIRIGGLALAVAVLGFVAGPGVAGAYLATLTFDNGGFDETIVPIGPESHGPYDWVESNGIRAAGFWAIDVGTPGGGWQQGHTHVQPNFGGRLDGRTEGMHAWTDDLQGLEISLDSGQTFDIVSIDWSIDQLESTNPEFQRLPWSVAVDDPRLLISTSFDPSQADFESQWTHFQLDDMGLPYNPFFTLPVTGFNDIDSFLVSHTAGGIQIDTIVLDINGPTPVPEPSAALLIGLGLAGLSRRAGRARQA